MVSNSCKYFKQEKISEIVALDRQFPFIKKVIGTFACANVQSYKLIETKEDVSLEGQNLSGYKLLVDVSIKGEVEYIPQNSRGKVCFCPFEAIKTIFVVVPKSINEVDIKKIIKEEKFKINPDILLADTIRLKKDLLQVFSLIFLNVEFI